MSGSLIVSRLAGADCRGSEFLSVACGIGAPGGDYSRRPLCKNLVHEQWNTGPFTPLTEFVLRSERTKRLFTFPLSRSAHFSLLLPFVSLCWLVTFWSFCKELGGCKAFRRRSRIYAQLAAADSSPFALRAKLCLDLFF